jgi:hypothetical protein
MFSPYCFHLCLLISLSSPHCSSLCRLFSLFASLLLSLFIPVSLFAPLCLCASLSMGFSGYLCICIFYSFSADPPEYTTPPLLLCANPLACSSHVLSFSTVSLVPGACTSLLSLSAFVDRRKKNCRVQI